MPDNEQPPANDDAWIAKTIALASAYRAACAALVEAREAWGKARAAAPDWASANVVAEPYERAYYRCATRASNARRALIEHASGGEKA